MGQQDNVAAVDASSAGSDPAANQRIRRYYRETAAQYDRNMGFADKYIVGDGRQWVAERAGGDVLEIGIGTARNLRFYAPDIRLTGLDLTPEMLELARQRAIAFGRDVSLHLGNAEALPFAAEQFDTVVATLVFCTVPDPAAAMAEVWRVLRPGGRLLLLEHVRSPVLLVRLVQRILDPWFVRSHADHLLREPLDDVYAAGFIVDEIERHSWGLMERVAATKPA